MPDVSIAATLLATVLGFVLGALWYGPLFGASWMRAAGFTKESLERGFNPVRAYAITFVLGLIQAWFFGALLGPAPALKSAVGWGLIAGLCWVAAALATNDIFERRPSRLTAINGGYHVVRFVLVGLAFGLLG